jgi:hypothetical protein
MTDRRTYSTPNVVLATTLKVTGHPPLRMRVRNGRVFWDFNLTDSLLDAVDQYVNGTCCVDPKTFLRDVNIMRDDMFDLLDASKTR